ncbi:hypothetical protein C8J57DRAFT_1508043 [Mycena rebaudengoi]|nr:hypothetical protein C8J57DRAFT_1508043 [Mycena rebaudengoi]
MATPDIVARNAPHHMRLIKSIAELDYVPEALAKQAQHIVKESTKNSNKERIEYEQLLGQRRMYKFKGQTDKFEAKAGIKERQYVALLEKETKAQDSETAVRTMIREALREEADLKDLGGCTGRLEGQNSRSSYPEDDQLEYQLQLETTNHSQIQGNFNQESQALTFLGSANDALVACIAKQEEATRNAQSWSKQSVALQNSALGTAQSFGLQAVTYTQQAQLCSRAVKPIGELHIAKAATFHMGSQSKNTWQVHQALKAELSAASERVAALRVDLDAAEAAVTHAGSELQAYRQRIFESVPAESLPPAYSADPDLWEADPDVP